MRQLGAGHIVTKTEWRVWASVGILAVAVGSGQWEAMALLAAWGVMLDAVSSYNQADR